MIKCTLVFFWIMLAGAISAQAEFIEITGFGSGALNPFKPSTDLLSSWTAAQTIDSVSVSGVSNQSGGIYSVLATPVDISSLQANLTLTGAFTGTIPSTDQFQLELYDANFNSISYNFAWSSFGGGIQTVTVPEIDFEGFNGSMSSYSLNLFGAPSDTVSFTFDNLEAGTPLASEPTDAPEPSPCLLWIIGSCIIGACRYWRRFCTTDR